MSHYLVVLNALNHSFSADVIVPPLKPEIIEPHVMYSLSLIALCAEAQWPQSTLVT